MPNNKETGTRIGQLARGRVTWLPASVPFHDKIVKEKQKYCSAEAKRDSERTKTGRARGRRS